MLFCLPSSLSDRKPVETEDEIVVMVVPDYQMLEYVQKIASDLSDDPVQPDSFSPLLEAMVSLYLFLLSP